jgi:hypothetical protein
MNLCKLQPGKRIYVGADEAHAWLEGRTSNAILNLISAKRSHLYI